MTTVENLRTPQLQSIDSSGFQNLHIGGSKLVVATDAEFNSVSIATLDSRTQKITSDGTSTFITGALVCDDNINVQGEVFNVNAQTTISDHFLVQTDGGTTNAVKIENLNNTQAPLVVDHAGSTIFSLATDGTITNTNIQTIESNLATEISDRASAVTSEATTRASADTTLQSNIDAEATTRATNDTTLQSNIDAEATARASADTTLQSNIDALTTSTSTTTTALETKTQHITADADETAFAVDSKVKWDTGDQYFCIKSRVTVEVAGSNTSATELDFKSHEYSIGSSQDGCYDVVLMDSAGDSTSPFFRGTLVKYSTGTSMLYNVASFECSAAYTQATSTLTFTFDSSITKTFTLTWSLVN